MKMNINYTLEKENDYYGITIENENEKRTIFFTEHEKKAKDIFNLFKGNEVTPISMGYILDDMYEEYN